nr:endonuclease/exonuclease/phosphatase family protein [Pedococcus cremeus]
MTRQQCDVWLLTEVHPALDFEGYEGHRTVESIIGARSWAGIWSRSAVLGLPDPHPASCLAVVEGTTFCSSILPWRSARSEHPWVGGNHAAKTQSTLSDLVPRLAEHRPLVWGGDWNHSLEGPERAGSMAGRRQLQEALAGLGLRAETAGLPHRLPGVRSIDHIAIDRRLQGEARAVLAVCRERRLSDHDAFVLDFEER